ncbi:MAG TPA: lysylphosphatidylglycerol synthase transmembrane domain-containing protein [Bacillota bacterium]|nr:lysylphosphatidylglycerol synthase transmembrane domain-containing protein [Bacillota bacterium]HQD80116.1 lysylphosphatidylglycerol synthase transmembrane domain-containing protein [Bacillota bacterium]
MSEEQQTRRRTPAQLRRSALIGVVFSVLGLYVVLQFTGGRTSWKEFAQIDPAMLAIACGLVIVTWLFDSLRMRALIRSLGGDLDILTGMRISIMGAFVSNVTPFDSGGEPMQAYLLTAKGLNAGQSTAVIAVKTICNALARFTLGIAASIWLFGFADFWSIPKAMYVLLAIGIILYFVVFAFSLYLIFHPEKINVIVVPVVRNKFTLKFFKPETLDAVLDRIDHELREFRNALQEFMENKKSALWKVMWLSYAWWITITIVPAVILVGLGITPKFTHIMGITLIFYLAAAYAPTPGSSGAAELGFSLLFSSVVPHGLIGLFVTVWRAFTYYLNLIVGGVLMAVSMIKKNTPSEKQGRSDEIPQPQSEARARESDTISTPSSGAAHTIPPAS